MSALLKLKKINLKYQTGKENISVLKDIDLIIKKKETVSVVGESGSGKTSLIMLIGGLERPTSGKIVFQDTDITNINDVLLASHILPSNYLQIIPLFLLHLRLCALERVSKFL